MHILRNKPTTIEIKWKLSTAPPGGGLPYKKGGDAHRTSIEGVKILGFGTA